MLGTCVMVSLLSHVEGFRQGCERVNSTCVLNMRHFVVHK